MEPSTELRQARRVLEEIPGCRIVEDLRWHAAESCWSIQFELLINGEDTSPRIPNPSLWVVIIASEYPLGGIEIYPAAAGGIERTFPHQAYNGPATSEHPWRKGRLCLSDPIEALDRLHERHEPSDASRRLAWWVQRAQAWLRAAFRGELRLSGDPFELPDFDEDSSRVYLVHAEDVGRWPIWEVAPSRAGIVDLRIVSLGGERLHVVESFHAWDGGLVVSTSWGPGMGLNHATRARGGWILLPGPPVLDPWQSPQTWGELRALSRQMNVDVDSLVELALRPLAGAAAPVLLVGFPMPSKVGADMVEVHWQPARMPKVPTKTQISRYGRARGWDLGRRRVLAETLGLRDDLDIRWGKSANWSSDRLGARGRLSAPLRASSVAMIGVGALGALVAELLVRAGVASMTLVDGDTLAAGNLVRHTLGIPDIGVKKAAAVAQRLKDASPHVEVRTIERDLDSARLGEVLGEVDIVIDCTAQDEVVDLLAGLEQGRSRRWISLSLGYEARRLYLFVADGPHFPAASFREAVGPWIADELGTISERDLPRDGPGCWSPLFPARYDAVMVMAGLAVSEIDARAADGPADASLVVIDAVLDDQGRLVRVSPVTPASS